MTLMSNPKPGRRKNTLPLCLVFLSFALVLACWSYPSAAALKDEKPSAPSLAQAIRQKVKEMDYADVVGDELAKMAAALKCDELKQALERVRLDYKRKKSSLSQLLKAEETVSKALFYYMYENIRYDFELKYNSLDYVVKDRKARCYGYAQLYYVLGDAIGLAVDIVGAEPDGNSLTPGGHACNLVHLSNGKVIMVGMALPTTVVSKQFMFKVEFAEDGNYWMQKNRGNHLKVHSKIQIRDNDAIRAAIYFNRSAEDENITDAAALAFLSKAIELDPKYAEVVLTRGMRYMRMKENKKALADFEKTVQIDPASSDGYCWRRDGAISNWAKTPRPLPTCPRPSNSTTKMPTHTGSAAASTTNSASETKPSPTSPRPSPARFTSAPGHSTNRLNLNPP